MEIWMNPACMKCRVAKKALDDAGVSYAERRYLEDPPSSTELSDVLERLGLEPWDIARPKETREAGIQIPRDVTRRDDWIAAMIASPRTIQRPIITADDGTTVVARDDATLARIIDR